MPYAIKKGNTKKGQKPYLIVNQRTGKVVGQSDDLNLANRSIAYRLDGEARRNNQR